MNCLVAHVTRRPPVKLTQRKQYKEPPQTAGARCTIYLLYIILCIRLLYSVMASSNRFFTVKMNINK